MYRNINNMYYFSRPNYGYAYGNTYRPYRLNFSRRYPRVVVYNGQQNFGFIGDNWGKLLLAGGLTFAGLHHFAPDVLGHIGSGLSNIAHSAGEGISNAAHSVGSFVSDKWHKFNEWKDFRDLKHTLAGRVAPENLDEMAHRIKEASKGNLNYTYDPYDPDNNNKIQKMIKKWGENIQNANKPVNDSNLNLGLKPGSEDLKLKLGLESDGSTFLSKENITKGISDDNNISSVRTTTRGSPYLASDNIANNRQPRGIWQNPSPAGSSYGAWRDISKSDHGGFR